MSTAPDACPFCLSPISCPVEMTGDESRALRKCAGCKRGWWVTLRGPNQNPDSDAGLYWSIRGEVACRHHVTHIEPMSWVIEGWAPLPMSSQGLHGRRYQCQECSPDHRAIAHPGENDSLSPSA